MVGKECVNELNNKYHLLWFLNGSLNILVPLPLVLHFKFTVDINKNFQKQFNISTALFTGKKLTPLKDKQNFVSFHPKTFLILLFRVKYERLNFSQD